MESPLTIPTVASAGRTGGNVNRCRVLLFQTKAQRQSDMAFEFEVDCMEFELHLARVARGEVKEDEIQWLWDRDTNSSVCV